jgi:Carbohydrate family 9 binding domain-like
MIRGCGIGLLLLAATCQIRGLTASEQLVVAEYEIPYSAAPITVDGLLAEACYLNRPAITQFTQASNPSEVVPATESWLFWNEGGLSFAFRVVDSNLAAQVASDDEHDVDHQDRVEVFLWSGNTNDPYHCIEIAAQGAVHDYLARFYRKFDDDWQAPGCKTMVTRNESGYIVEGHLSAEGLAQMKYPLASGKTWSIGLFRADFDRYAGTPTWINWKDSGSKDPDFHVATAFKTVRLAAE